MKLRNIIICTSALLVMASGELFAQIDRNVEVTKAYIPSIEPSNKLMLTPDMSDDSYIMPDIDYSITPISIQSTFELTPYSIATMNFLEYEPNYNYYLKGGIGAPFQSVVDLYASSFNVDQNFVMGYFNQSGRYANIDNDYDVEHAGSSQSHFRVGTTAGTYVGEKGRLLRGDINYKSDLWSRYATYCDSEYSHPLYQRVEFTGQYGDDFSLANKLNYLVRGRANHFWSNSDYSSTLYSFDGAIGGSVGGGKLLAMLGYDGVSASNDMGNSTFNVGVEYSRYGDRLRWVVGAKLYSDRVADYEQNTYFTPRLLLDYNISKTSLILYFDIDGGLRQNDFASLSDINPYLRPSTYGVESTVEYDFDLGIKGVLGNSNKFAYNLYATYNEQDGYCYWAFTSAGALSNNYFVLSQSKLTTMSLSGEVEYMPKSNRSLLFKAVVAKYNDDDLQPYANGLPTSQLSAEWCESLGHFDLSVIATYRSSRSVSEIDLSDFDTTPTTLTLPSEFDLGAAVEYNVSGKFAMFGEVSNILNQKIYNWVHYREYGINFMVGAKIQF